MELSESKIICYKCNQKLDYEKNVKILRHEECEHCSCQLHCCCMCTFYDKNSYNDCREPNAERIVDKEKANFCSYFTLEGRSNDYEDLKKTQLEAAMNLFKK